MSKKILFIIDMQNDFIDGSLGSDDAKRIVPNIIKLIQTWDKNQMIWYTQDTHYENSNMPYKPNYNNTLEGKLLPVKHCIENTPGWQLNEYIQDALLNQGCIIHKCIKNTFGAIDMVKDASMYLCNNIDSTDELVITGLCTDICVISNALLMRAQFPNLKITCYEDCCAGTSKEAHEAALTIMKSNQINVTKFIKE